MDVVGNVRFDARAHERFAQALDARRSRVVELTKHHERIDRCVPDVSRRDDVAHDSAKAAKDVLAAKGAGEMVGRFHAVLQRDCDGVLANQRPGLLRSLGNLPRFSGEDHRIDRSDARWIVGGRRIIDDEVAVDAVDAQSTRAQRSERRATCDEHGVDARFGELAAEVAADSAHSDNRDSQSMRTTPSATFGKRVSTAGSCPGMISAGFAAIVFIRSWARRFDWRSNVCAIGARFSRFS